MPESAEPQNDFSLEASMTEGGAPLESIVCTEELHRRPWRPPDFEKENRALVALVTALSDSATTIFQTLAETILDVTQCDSSGLSLLTPDGGKRFFWPAIAGMWAPHVGGGTPRNFGPCGDVLDRDCTMLFRHFERRYPYLMPVVPAAEECLLVPFYVDGKAVGTIWGIMHSDRRRFDSEDGRIMGALGQFASVAYRTVASIDDLKVQVAARETAEAELRERATGLEAKVRRLIDANLMGIFTWNVEGRIVEANETLLKMVQRGREDLVSAGMRLIPLGQTDGQRVLAALEPDLAVCAAREKLSAASSTVTVPVSGSLVASVALTRPVRSWPPERSSLPSGSSVLAAPTNAWAPSIAEGAAALGSIFPEAGVTDSRVTASANINDDFKQTVLFIFSLATE